MALTLINAAYELGEHSGTFAYIEGKTITLRKFVQSEDHGEWHHMSLTAREQYELIDLITKVQPGILTNFCRE